MAETARAEPVVLVAMVRAELAASIVTVVVRVEASQALRHVRTIRTATAIMHRADVVVRAALTVVVREVRVASVADRVELVALTVVARADREALDLVQAEWEQELRFLR